MIYDIELNSAAHYPVAGIVELSPLIEQAGFGAFWKGESNSTDPLMLISGIAARTKKLKLGTAIYHIYGRSPVTLGSPVRHLAGSVGRETAAGSRRRQQDDRLLARRRRSTGRCAARANTSISFARPPPESASNTRERSITHRDNASSFPGSPAIPHFPIYLAGLGPQMTALVGKISDGVFINMATPATIRRSPAASAPARSKRAAIRARSRSSPRCACRCIRTARWPARACARC